MKKCLYALLLLIPIAATAQKQGNIWHFGFLGGLDFSGANPVYLPGGMTGSDSVGLFHEGSGSISDSSGRLLFYAADHTAWNRNHQRMPNGDSLHIHPSSAQSCLIIPKPGSDSLFYIFANDELENYSRRNVKGYRYSIVDMCLDNGRGDVVAGRKNIRLIDSATEKLAACSDSAGTGYWVMGHKMYSNEFYAWHLTAAGITDTVVSRVGHVHGSLDKGGQAESSSGQMKFNPSGTKLALAIPAPGNPFLELFDFNPATGVVSNPCRLFADTPSTIGIYGVEFSPDGSKLYTTVSSITAHQIYEYHLSSTGNCGAVQTSGSVMFNRSNSPGNSDWAMGMQLGPDGKIYVNTGRRSTIGCINAPNLGRIWADFDPYYASAAPLDAPFITLSFPSFVAGYKYHNGIACKQASTGVSSASGSAPMLYPNPVTHNAVIDLGGLTDIHGMQFVVSDAMGRTIKKVAVDQRVMSVDFTDTAPGIYYYHLQQPGRSVKSGKIARQ